MNLIQRNAHTRLGKLLVQFLALGALASACGLDSKPPKTSTALIELAANTEYRTAVAEFNKFDDLAEAEAFAQVTESDTHSAYTAFLVSFPETLHAASINKKISEFRLFETEAGEIIPYEDKSKFCWSDEGRIGYWRAGGLAGAMTGGPITYFGPMTFWSTTGSVQLLSGSVVMRSEGLELSAGTKFIYQTKCQNQ